MPEGDTVHMLTNALKPRLEGRQVATVKLSDGTVIADAKGESVRALGKHLLFTLSDGRTVRSHLGMHGSWHRYPHGAPWRKPAFRASLVLETSDAVLVCFNASAMEILRCGSLRDRDFRAGIGPDLADGRVDAAKIRNRARARRTRGTADRSTPRPANRRRHRKRLQIRGPIPPPIGAAAPMGIAGG